METEDYMVENGGEEEDFFPLFLNNKSLFWCKISREAIYLFIQSSFIVTDIYWTMFAIRYSSHWEYKDEYNSPLSLRSLQSGEEGIDMEQIIRLW